MGSFTRSKPSIQLVMDNIDLNGTNRFVSDGLLTSNECKLMIKLAESFARLGDGYRGNPSPHTTSELFEGITLGRAALLYHYGQMDYNQLKLYLKSTEIAKGFLEQHFNIKRKLYFTYTHLVCRSAITDATNRSDLSHPIHADNCNIMKNGFCRKSQPAYTWRDYSAIIYLNHNFRGGDFFFSKDMLGNIIESTLKPKCGRMIGFSSGGENLHGVKAVTKGTRCAIAVWFTFNERYKDNDVDTVYKLLLHRTT